MTDEIHVLILEDQEVDAELMEQELRREGIPFRARRVATEAEYAAGLQAPELRLILSDNTLPGYDGLAALARARRERPEVPFIFVTGTLGEEIAIDALHHGATDYVLKQRLSRLRPAVQRALEIQRTQAALLESEKRFRSLVNAMEDSVFILDREQRLVGAFGRLPGGGDQVGKRWSEIHAGPGAEVHERAALRALAGEPIIYEWTLDEPARGRRYLQTSLSPMRSEQGEITGLVAVGRDVTELKKIQAGLLASERMASVGLLAAGIAHEINNPLAVISANLEIVAQELRGAAATAGPDRGPPGKLSECVADAREAAERVREIVRDLKVFSRADDAEARSVVAPEHVLESATRMARNEIKHRARLVKDYQPVPAVRGNESRLGQVFLNLLVNAAQAIPEGHAEANEIRVATRTGADGGAVIEIADTGQGMTPEIVDRLFTPFFTTKPVGVGTGLGLSICHRIVESLGGRITVESVPGRGSTFRVLLPPARAGAGDVRQPRPAPGKAPRRGRVLVVDDEPAIGKILQRVLARDHEVVTMTQASEAIGAIEDGRRFDVILCDVLMPHATGMDVYARLREIAPDQAARIIFVSGGAFTSGARRFLDEVPNDRLDKPFDLDRLRAVVNAHVR